MVSTIALLTCLLIPQQVPDYSDKRCVVTEVVNEGTRSDCGGWKPLKGEKLVMPPAVNKQLKVGDTFYFVWKKPRWVAEIKKPADLILPPEKQRDQL